MGKLSAILVFFIPLFLGACSSGVGACIASGGLVDECKDDWTTEECQDWDDQEINGSSWEYHDGDSCSDLGYGVSCTDGSKVKSSSDC